MKTINIKTIRIDGGTQSRVAINNELVQDYAQAIESGTEFPPVVVFNDGVDNWLADGFHRFHAHNAAGKASIAADVRMGTARDAVLFSVGANGTHGLNRTNADKRKAVETLLADSEWAQWSNVAVAKACAVSEGFVRHLRINEDTPATRTVERNGKTYEQDTANIGKVAKQAPPPPAPVVEPESEEPPEYTELDAAYDQISELQSELVIARMGDIPEEQKSQAIERIADLQAELKTANAVIKALTNSRDTLQEENAQMKRQMKAQREEIARLKTKK